MLYFDKLKKRYIVPIDSESGFEMFPDFVSIYPDDLPGIPQCMPPTRTSCPLRYGCTTRTSCFLRCRCYWNPYGHKCRMQGGLHAALPTCLCAQRARVAVGRISGETCWWEPPG